MACRLGEDAFYWARPDGQISLCATGSFDSIDIRGEHRFQEASAWWSARRVDWPVPFAVGGFSFEDHPTDGGWSQFGAGRLTVPRNLCIRRGDRCWRIQPAAMSVSHSSQHAEAREDPPTIASVMERNGSLAQAFLGNVRDATAKIASGELEKVAIARSETHFTAQAAEPAVAMVRLAHQYPTCAVFAVRRSGQTFIGATPERLVQVAGGVVSVSALAGTAPRATDSAADQAIAEALLANRKNLHEHRVVVATILERLARVCTEIRGAELPRILSLPNVHHLFTPIQALPLSTTNLIDLIEALHPTPAVGGTPAIAARRFIREREGSPRGWYAGPVGWIDASGEGEFVVALRSALLDDRGWATLYAGNGIVDGSDPLEELEETRLKLRPMKMALGIAS